VRFVFVDEIVDLVPGKAIHAAKTLSGAEELFEDHFPGFAVVPGVLLIEMMAQTAGKCLDAEARARGKAVLVQVKRGSFRQWVRPDQRADIYARITASTDEYGMARCRILVEHQVVSEAELMFAYLAYERLAGDYRDDVLEQHARRIGPGTPGQNT
jgi:3-hydroxyacyl-[acyl-carrier-protein] dehydratase